MHQHAQASSCGNIDCAQSLLPYKVGGYPIRAPTSPITLSPPSLPHYHIAKLYDIVRCAVLCEDLEESLKVLKAIYTHKTDSHATFVVR